jgi:hypothetical protein
VLNACRESRRGATRRARALLLLPAARDIASAEESALIGEANREVMAALRALPARQREAVVLRYYLDLNEDQAAATGQRERVLYRYTAQCTRDGVGALGWVGPDGTVVAMADDGLLPTSLPPVSPGVPAMSSKVIIGVLARGKLTPLLPATLPFSQGLGTIAF